MNAPNRSRGGASRGGAFSAMVGKISEILTHRCSSADLPAAMAIASATTPSSPVTGASADGPCSMDSMKAIVSAS
eukprot:scaffold12970_cov113-Isochrysis_galbana.AAC.2